MTRERARELRRKVQIADLFVEASRRPASAVRVPVEPAAAYRRLLVDRAVEAVELACSVPWHRPEVL